MYVKRAGWKMQRTGIFYIRPGDAQLKKIKARSACLICR